MRATRATTRATMARGYARAPPPPIRAVADVWEEVIDERSGQRYWWNIETDEYVRARAMR